MSKETHWQNKPQKDASRQRNPKGNLETATGGKDVQRTDDRETKETLWCPICLGHPRLQSPHPSRDGTQLLHQWVAAHASVPG